MDAWTVADPTACPECGRDACEGHHDVALVENASEVLQFFTLKQLAARVRAAGPRKYLLSGWWPAGDYGVLSAEMKAQKTWTALDMAVSVASNTPFLGYIAVEQSGPVLVFSGEGSEGTLWRRLDAHGSARGLDTESLPIVVCTRAPHLRNPEHLALLEQRIAQVRPVLVIVDPLYLAARGSTGSDLYAMGETLEEVQHICQRQRAALLVVHHHNRKEGSGASRMSGAGPAEWGRVLLTLDVRSRHTDPDTKETTVITQLDAIGGEIPDQSLRIIRKVRAADPTSLDSPLTVTTEVEVGEAVAGRADAENLGPAATKLLAALTGFPSGVTQRELIDAFARQHGHGLRRETASRTLNDLERRGRVRSSESGTFQSKVWRLCDPCDVTRDVTPGIPRVTACDLPIGDHAPGSHGDDHTESGGHQDHTMAASPLASHVAVAS